MPHVQAASKRSTAATTAAATATAAGQRPLHQRHRRHQSPPSPEAPAAPAPKPEAAAETADDASPMEDEKDDASKGLSETVKRFILRTACKCGCPPCQAVPSFAMPKQCPSSSLLRCCIAEPNVGNGHDHDTYAWTQTLGDVSLSVPVPDGTKGRSCDVSIARTRLKVPAWPLRCMCTLLRSMWHMRANAVSEAAGAGSLPAWPLRRS